MLVVGLSIYAWRKSKESEPVPTQVTFFRMDPEEPNGPLRTIDPGDATVEPGDVLGLNLVKSGGAVVYALSVFGSKDGERLVWPWNATDAEHIDEFLKQDPRSRPWGWTVSKPLEQVICVRIAADEKSGDLNELEGLLVFVSSEPRPEFERWKDALWRVEGEVGVPYGYDRALEILQAGEPVTRGVSPPRSWDSQQRDNVKERLIRARKNQSLKLGLPGVEDYSIVCLVDKKTK
jgi:hypothetical protein